MKFKPGWEALRLNSLRLRMQFAEPTMTIKKVIALLLFNPSTPHVQLWESSPNFASNIKQISAS